MLNRKILHECYDAPSTGHLGIQRTLVLILSTFFWPKMRSDVHKYVTQCLECQINKSERIKASSNLHTLDIPSNKWENISTDFIVSWPRTQSGDDAVWVVVDKLTKLARFITTKTMLNIWLIKLLMNYFIFMDYQWILLVIEIPSLLVGAIPSYLRISL